jgi:hypothetical protein
MLCASRFRATGEPLSVIIVRRAAPRGSRVFRLASIPKVAALAKAREKMVEIGFLEVGAELTLPAHDAVKLVAVHRPLA